MPDELYRRVRERALSDGRTVTSFIEESLRESLERYDNPAGPVDFVVEPFEGTGVQPGVDLTDSASLLDLMEH